MYSIFKNVSTKKILAAEIPSLGVSMAVAELNYKFGSFTVECLAFLTTWCLVSFVIDKVFFKSPGS